MNKARFLKLTFILLGITLSAIILAAAGFVYFWDSGGVSYVSDQPDLMRNCGNSAGDDCSVWANNHASDFVPVKEARNLKVAITQEVLAPAPEIIVMQFALPPAVLRKYLKNKTPVTESADSTIESFAEGHAAIRGFPFNRLTWWPPQQTPSLRVYTARSLKGGDHYIFVDEKSNLVTVFASASRGR